MKRADTATTQRTARRASFLIGIAAFLVVSLALPLRADKKSEARIQFEHAVTMRTVLEGYLEKDRGLSDYKQTVAAYQKVYAISPQADEVTPALMAEGELYREMGRLYDAAYFQSSIEAYNFLLKQYLGSRYRSAALFAIADIQKDELKKPDIAEATYKKYLKRFPASEKAGDARAALQEIAASRQVEAPKPPELKGERVEPRAGNRPASITAIRTWNFKDSTRILVTLDNTIAYDADRILSPDRIYFDLRKAHMNPRLSGTKVDDSGGLLKSVRIAQNKPEVVRLVLDVDGAKNYSAFLLSNPYRLVIDVHSNAVGDAKNVPASTTASPPATKAPDKPAETSATKPSEIVSVPTDSKPPAAKPTSKSKPEAAAKQSASAANSRLNAGSVDPPSEAKPTRDGQRSLSRALGLKISRIVIDPGHGGFDTGTVGPHGLMEKDLCLDVALRLGRLVDQKLPGAEVIYTRKDDTFIPLEQRTAIANESKADLFISIHANSSRDPSARGIETYYLNFATSPESMEVAARENSNSQESMHDLQDLIKKIARNEKIEESKELAGDIQNTLAQRLQVVSHRERNRGVKKAPFVVLIGANMPSVLSEISFVSNPNDEQLLRRTGQRQRIAEGIYRGIAAYLDNLNSLKYNRQKLVSDNSPSAASDRSQ
jgi:N-acetylmuramoyl-L-alanine amidase